MKRAALAVGLGSALGIVLGLAAVYIGLSFGILPGDGLEFP